MRKIIQRSVERQCSDRSDGRIGRETQVGVHVSRFVTYLRAQGIKDPDVDLFWSVISGDKTIAQDALNRGAKLNVTETELISRYHDLWNKFNEEPRTVQPPSETPR